ncbi:PREDICTED: uncharacterized protein LOC101637420 [Condylura cristata]|uniref:uncharacterized protein LOC101637420 n=1 Tax=Condylura cristata TaxID=143302 RepID=UPI0003343E79|nr:PREDICTED: uncharacterized protein LOC101637420 [Condylura cristata]
MNQDRYKKLVLPDNHLTSPDLEVMNFISARQGSIKIEGGNGNVTTQQNALEQLEPDYFKDMAPTIRKTQKIIIKKREPLNFGISDGSTGFSSRLAATQDLPFIHQSSELGDLDTWQENTNAWEEEEDAAWQAEEVLRQQKIADREQNGEQNKDSGCLLDVCWMMVVIAPEFLNDFIPVGFTFAAIVKAKLEKQKIKLARNTLFKAVAIWETDLSMEQKAGMLRAKVLDSVLLPAIFTFLDPFLISVCALRAPVAQR